MKTPRKIYTCPTCGYRSEWPIPEYEQRHSEAPKDRVPLRALIRALFRTAAGTRADGPLRLEEVKTCREIRRERRQNYIGLGVIIVACTTLPFLISALLALISRIA